MPDVSRYGRARPSNFAILVVTMHLALANFWKLGREANG